MRNDKAETLEEAHRLLAAEMASTEFPDFFKKKYYVEKTAISKKIEEIKQNTTMPKKIVVCSHRGSGKTTELMHLKEELESNNDLFVIFLSLKEANLHSYWPDLYLTGILFLLLRITFEELLKKKIELPSEIQNTLWLVLTNIKKKDVRIPEGKASEQIVKLLKVLVETGIDKSKADIDSVNTILKDVLGGILVTIKSLNKKLLFIIEDLGDESDDRDKTYKALRQLGNHFRNLESCIILVVPHHTRGWQQISELGEFYFLPIFQVTKKDGSRNTEEIEKMKEIVTRRLEKGLIEDVVIETSALYSGGLVRPFLELLRGCCEKALTTKTKINIETLKAVFREKVDLAATTSDEIDFEKIRQVPSYKNDPNKVKSDKTLRSLMFRDLILEYRDDQGISWFNISPTLYWVEARDKQDRNDQALSWFDFIPTLNWLESGSQEQVQIK